MDYQAYPELDEYRHRSAIPESNSIMSASLAAFVALYCLYKSLEMLGYPVRLWFQRSIRFLGHAWPNTSNEDTGDEDGSKSRDDECNIGNVLGSRFTDLLHYSARGVASVIPSGLSREHPAGLINSRNSCYQNSIIQALASLPSLEEYLGLIIAHYPSLSRGTSTRELCEIIQKLNDPHNNGTSLSVSTRLIQMNTFMQQDAQEYLSMIFAALDEEVQKAFNIAWLHSIAMPNVLQNLSSEEAMDCKSENNEASPANPQPIAQTSNASPFEGSTIQRVNCVRCGYSAGLALTPFSCLPLLLGNDHVYDIRNCLDEYTRREYIDQAACNKCTLLNYKVVLEETASKNPESFIQERLDMVRKALDEEDYEDVTLNQKLRVPRKYVREGPKWKQTVVARAPPTLVLYLNRSDVDPWTAQSYKKTTHVLYPDRLDIGPWVLSSAWPKTDESLLDEKENSGESCHYALRAAVVHHGVHDRGHYVCYRSRPRATSEQYAEDPPRSSGQPASKDQWWRYSDETVTEVSDAAAHRNDVFMLFYERLEAPTENAPIHALNTLGGSVDHVPNKTLDMNLPRNHNYFGEPPTYVSTAVEPVSEAALLAPLPDYEDEDFMELPSIASSVLEDTEISGAESDDALVTPFTSDYDSEVDTARLFPPKPGAVPTRAAF